MLTTTIGSLFMVGGVLWAIGAALIAKNSGMPWIGVIPLLLGAALMWR